MSQKTKTIIILLTPFALVLGVLWVAAVFNATRWLCLNSQQVGTEMWWRSIFALISAGGFAVMALLFVKILRNPPKLKKRRRR